MNTVFHADDVRSRVNSCVNLAPPRLRAGEKGVATITSPHIVGRHIFLGDTHTYIIIRLVIIKGIINVR